MDSKRILKSIAAVSEKHAEKSTNWFTPWFHQRKVPAALLAKRKVSIQK